MKEYFAIGDNETAWESRTPSDSFDDISPDRHAGSWYATIGPLIETGEAYISEGGSLCLDDEMLLPPGRFAISVYDDKIEVFPWIPGQEEG